MPTTAEEAAELPALKPRSSKSVLIEEPESLTPQPSPRTVPADQGPGPTKQYRSSTSRRLSGRPSTDSVRPSLHSIPSVSSIGPTEPSGLDKSSSKLQAQPKLRHHAHASHIVSQVADWLHGEKTKRAAHRTGKRSGHAKLAQAAEATKGLVDHVRSDESKHHKGRHDRSGSDASDSSLALERLEQILAKTMSLEIDDNATPMEGRRDSYFPPRKPSTKRQGSKKLLRKGSTVISSDNEVQESDIDVPSAEVVLDNSKTLSYNGGAAASESDLQNTQRRAVKEREAWSHFKHEIVRLTHTLRLKGWKRLPIERSAEIDVERLSGALTNAVYVVSPPTNLPETPSIAQDSTLSLVPKKPPPKLLLRIYGPQVEHLIDRESELQILRRLARQKIGPRMLGTFTNGRFEQFFHARTLTARDLRIPETSRHIAKRMRELHDGIDLLEEERNDGPFIWLNWDKWKDRCEEVISYLDNQILASKQGATASRSEEWKKYGLICGVEWSVFRSAVRQYRDWLSEQYGGIAGLKEKLVFAHNDTQYGNLLRLEPSGESPLLLPSNEHKQLIVIDFEYASANVPGLEFANHFTEWCYNYHDQSKAYALNPKNYPTPEEQHRFFKAYIQHRSPGHSRPSLAPTSSSTPGPTSSISTFMLDSRAPPAQLDEEEEQRDLALEKEIERLTNETRMWRIANSAQWVAWGIVQAKVPGMDEALEAQKPATSGQSTPQAHLQSDPLSPEMAASAEDARDKRPEEEAHDEEEGFDYLGYAHERALFFWGDVLQLGIVKREDLPQALLEKVKIVEY